LSFSLINNIQDLGLIVPLSLFLLAFLGFRFKVTPRAKLNIKASAEKVFSLIDVYDGRIQNYGRTTIEQAISDPATNTYKFTYTTTIIGGTASTFSAFFRIAERIPGKRLVLVREGLQDAKTDNQLLKIEHNLSEKAGQTVHESIYYWGKRASFAQLVARADLWSGAYRLKSLAETGVPSERAHIVISGLVALISAVLSLVAFGAFLGMGLALVVIAVLFVHEFGHLLAYRLIGQPWGRMMFLPLVGGIAIPRLPFQTQGEAVFAALMGPGLSTILAIACALPFFLSGESSPLLASIGLVTVMINLFNLTPAEPLDGGIAIRSILAKLVGRYARYWLLAIGAIMVGIGLAASQIIFVVFGGIALLGNVWPRKIDNGLKEMSSLQSAISIFSYIAMASAYFALLEHFSSQLSALPTGVLS
jgi:Zn-dependent protease